MSDFIIIGKRLVPRDQIALVEAYEPSERNPLQTTRLFQGRVILVSRDSVLIEQTPEAFSEASGLRMLDADRTGINATIAFRVETFAPAPDFTPIKPYVTRLKWRDPRDGNDHSKLLLTPPEAVLSAVTGKSPESKLPPPRGNGSRPRRARSSTSPKSELTQS